MNKCESLSDLYNRPPKHITLVVLQNYLFQHMRSIKKQPLGFQALMAVLHRD
jgi:hypothetical protein